MRRSAKAGIFLGLILLAASAIAEEFIQAIPLKQVYSHYRITIFRHERQIGSGSGVAISPRRILTAGHVAIGFPGVTYHCDLFSDAGRFQRSIPLHIVATNGPASAADDLGLLEADEDLPYCIDMKYGTAEIGEFIYIIGAAYGTSPQHVSVGRYTERDNPEVPGLSAAFVILAPGNSGGGVFNFRHELMGILVQGETGTTYSLFVPVNRIQTFLDGVAHGRANMSIPRRPRPADESDIIYGRFNYTHLWK